MFKKERKPVKVIYASNEFHQFVFVLIPCSVYWVLEFHLMYGSLVNEFSFDKRFLYFILMDFSSVYVSSDSSCYEKDK